MAKVVSEGDANRYRLHGVLGKGGHGTVHLATLEGPLSFSREVAIKQLNEGLDDPALLAALLDEARLTARIRHPNVISTIDVVAAAGSVCIVMEYVEGETLSRLLAGAAEQDERLPVSVVLAIATGLLRGLHAAHEARDAAGSKLDIVHRDVSPQNVLVGLDGTARVFDFGIARHRDHVSATVVGQVRGKIGYLAPEQIHGAAVDRRVDIWAAGVILWEMLAGARLFRGKTQDKTIRDVLEGNIPSLATKRTDLEPALIDVVRRALLRRPDDRFPTADAMARAIDAIGPVAPPSEVADWIAPRAAAAVAARRATIESAGATATMLLPTLAVALAPARSTRITEPPPSPSGRAVPRPWLRVSLGGAAVLASLVAVAAAVRCTTPAAPRTPLTTVSLAPTESSAVTEPIAIPSLEPSSSSAPARRLRPDVERAELPSATTARRPRSVHRPEPALPGCDPPFMIDAHGTKHFKRECFTQ